MMYKYAERCFSRDRFQWAKCVFKYMYDGLTPDHTQLFVLLAEVSNFQFCLRDEFITCFIRLV